MDGDPITVAGVPRVVLDRAFARFEARLREEDVDEAAVARRTSRYTGRTLRDRGFTISKTVLLLAAAMVTTQASVSKLERRSDVYLSSARRYVEAMGGEMEITAFQTVRSA